MRERKSIEDDLLQEQLFFNRLALEVLLDLRDIQARRLELVEVGEAKRSLIEQNILAMSEHPSAMAAMGQLVIEDRKELQKKAASASYQAPDWVEEVLQDS